MARTGEELLAAFRSAKTEDEAIDILDSMTEQEADRFHSADLDDLCERALEEEELKRSPYAYM